MGIKDVLKVNRKTFLDPRSWLGYDVVKNQTATVIGLFKQVFFPKVTPGHAETFEHAQQRLKISENELQEIGQAYFSYALLFFAIGVLAVAGSIYLLVSSSFAGFILALSLAIFLFGQAFRNHFLYFQIKNRKLGCTYEEWREGKPKDNDSDDRGLS